MEKTRYRAIACVLGLLGIWIIVAGFIIKAANANRFDDLIVCLAVVFFGMLLSKEREVHGWSSQIFGAWMMITAFIPDFQVESVHLWNNVIVGILIATAGFTALGGGLSTFRIPRG
jgi:hypothetical protein